jgi:ribosomal protein S18 acetylase RimI-like enzyme
MVSVQHASGEDRDAVGDVLAQAFFDDPLVKWIIPDDDVRRTANPVTFRASFDDAFPAGEIWVCRDGDALAGVAIWYPPGTEAGRPAVDETAERPQLNEIAAQRGAMVGEQMAKHHPSEHHYYLRAVGVLPAHQGLSIGGALLGAVTASCDREQVGAYLEATSDNSRRLYERHGFQAAAPMDLGDGPALYPMWRYPRPVTT